MQGRRRQHEAERIQARGNAIGKSRSAPAAQQDDRGLGSGERRRLGIADAAIAPDDVEIPGDHRERLRTAALALPQPLDGRGIGRIADQMIAAKPFDRDDLAFLNQAAGGIDVVEHRVLVETDGAAVEANQGSPRAATVAGNRRVMKAPVRRVPIFGKAGRAHLEGRHGRSRTVDRRAFQDGQARPALGAIGKRIAIAALERAEHLRGAGIADRGVRRDFAGNRAARAVGDAEHAGQTPLVAPAGDRLDAGQRRRVAVEPFDELLDRAGRPLQADQHARRVIDHFAAQMQVARDVPDGLPQADALHPALDPDLQGYGLVRAALGLGGHRAASQSITRLLPESATMSVSPQAVMP